MEPISTNLDGLREDDEPPTPSSGRSSGISFFSTAGGHGSPQNSSEKPPKTKRGRGKSMLSRNSILKSAHKLDNAFKSSITGARKKLYGFNPGKLDEKTNEEGSLEIGGR